MSLLGDEYMKYIGNYSFTLTVNADTPAEAKKKLAGFIEDLAGSNDGSELLANLEPDTVEEL